MSREAAGDDFGDGGGEDLVAVEVEELDGAGDVEAEARAGERPALEERVERGRDGAEAVAALELAGGAPLGDEAPRDARAPRSPGGGPRSAGARRRTVAPSRTRTVRSSATSVRVRSAWSVGTE